MIPWKYANLEKTIVVRTHPDGKTESCLVDTPEVKEYLAQGFEILPMGNGQ